MASKTNAANGNEEDLRKLVRQMQEQLNAVQKENKRLQERVDALEKVPRNQTPLMKQKWEKIQTAFEKTYDYGCGGADRNSSSSRGGYGHRDASAKELLVFLHPEEVLNGRNYTPEELERVKRRPFASRLFVCNIQVDWNSVWLRTRHTDNHRRRSSFIYLRDAFKADTIRNNKDVTKQALSNLLSIFSTASTEEESAYFSFACTVASAFSSGGSNLEFSKNLLLHAGGDVRNKKLGNTKSLVRSESGDDLDSAAMNRILLKREQKEARKRLIQIMDIYFSGVKRKSIVMDTSKHNIYRLGHCLDNKLEYSKIRPDLLTFIFQLCCFVYTALSLFSFDDSPDFLELDKKSLTQNFALASITFVYCLLVATCQMATAKEAFWCYYKSKLSLLAVMDITINYVLPIPVAICAFFLVLNSQSLLDAVMNALALLFITSLDEEMPNYVTFDNTRIGESFLINSTLEEYETQDRRKEIEPIEFSDLIITNNEEGGQESNRNVTFQPHEVFEECTRNKRKRKGTARVDSKNAWKRYSKGFLDGEVIGTRSVTPHCLLRKVEWQYTNYRDDACQPRIGHLKLHKLIDGTRVDIVSSHKETDESKRPFFSVTGVFIITFYAESEDVARFRICGSQTPQDFQKAFEYYSLWPIEPSAVKLLESAQINATKKELLETRRVIYGFQYERPKLKKA